MNSSLPVRAHLLACAWGCAAAVVLPAAAQTPSTGSGPAFPIKPIRIVVPFTPGGPNDILARMAGQHLTAVWGQQVVVDNRPGGGTIIGTDTVAKAPPDGHTLLMVATAFASTPSLHAKLPYDTARDFTPVIQMVSSPNVLVVHPSLPAKNVKELIAVAKARPGQIAFASGGTGSLTHLAGELVRLSAGAPMTHIPYKGAAPATVALIGGEVSWMFGTILPTLPHVKSGKLRAIAVSGSQRVDVLPGVPTVAETLKGFDASSWYGLFAPAATPLDIIAKLNREVAAGLNVPEVRARLAQEGTVVVAGTPEQFGALVKADMAKWARVIREAGIQQE
ncbi:MAG: tripartite tricarboxylate transporter substrate binding protein [Burkholderiales bacterium]